MDTIRDARGVTEEEAIARYKSRNYPKPALTADIVVLSEHEGSRYVLLIRRKGHPFLGKFALPGGFANENEPVEQTAARELAEETGVENLQMQLLGIYSTPGRDPRGWVVSAAFTAAVPWDSLNVAAGDDAEDALWFRLEETETGITLHCCGETILADELAFDHAAILSDALQYKR